MEQLSLNRTFGMPKQATRCTAVVDALGCTKWLEDVLCFSTTIRTSICHHVQTWLLAATGDPWCMRICACACAQEIQVTLRTNISACCYLNFGNKQKTQGTYVSGTVLAIHGSNFCRSTVHLIQTFSYQIEPHWATKLQIANKFESIEVYNLTIDLTTLSFAFIALTIHTCVSSILQRSWPNCFDDQNVCVSVARATHSELTVLDGSHTSMPRVTHGNKQSMLAWQRMQHVCGSNPRKKRFEELSFAKVMPLIANDNYYVRNKHISCLWESNSVFSFELLPRI